MDKKPAVFFDRDGVLNREVGYLYKKEDFIWTPGAVEAVRAFGDAGRLLFVVTNQSGVARGYYTEADVAALHRWMNAELARRGARIDAFYYCPHLKDGVRPEYAVACRCRKPLPGMLERAAAEWPVDLSRSVLIGDRDSDLACAAAAGVRGVKFPGGDLWVFLREAGLL